MFDGSEGYDVEGLGDLLGARCLNFDVGELERADCFAEERRLFLVGFDEGDVECWDPELDGDSGKAGARADVGQGCGGSCARVPCWKKLLRGEERFAKVAGDDFLGRADGGKVGARVPAKEEVDVGGDLVEQNFGQVGCRASLF